MAPSPQEESVWKERNQDQLSRMKRRDYDNDKIMFCVLVNMGLNDMG